MRLLICTGSRSIHGGVENIIADLCRNLPKHGIEPIVGLGKGIKFNNPDLYREAFPDLPTINIDGTKGTRQARVESLIDTLRKVSPDIVLIARLFDVYEALRYLKKSEKVPRLAVTIQAYEPHYLYDAFLYRDIIDLVVTSGELIRQALIQWAGIEETRIVNIPGGVHLPSNQVTPRSPKKPLRIGYVGRIDAGQKRILDVAPFVERLVQYNIDFTLDIVGTGPAETELKKLLAPYMKSGIIIFHGWQDHKVLYQSIYPKLDVFIHFAHTEGVTIAPREAMAHGVVPIVSDFIGLKAEGQFIHEVNALTFPIGDINKAAQNVLRLINESGLLERLSAEAMRSHTGKYNYDGAIEEWASAFGKCMEKPAKKTGDFKVVFPADGRLGRLGMSPWLAQRIRDLFGKRPIHIDGGSEWPTNSGLMSKEKENEILRLVDKLDNKYFINTH